MFTMADVLSASAVNEDPSQEKGGLKRTRTNDTSPKYVKKDAVYAITTAPH